MAPPKKSEKIKQDSKKLKKIKKKKGKVKTIRPPISAENGAAIDSDWWDSFWSRNSSSLDSSVPLDEEEGFKYFFRVSKRTFEYICSLVREDLISRPPSGLINIEGRLLSVEKQVAIAVRRLASGESQVSVGASFGVGQSTVSQVTWRFIEALEERGRQHLTWPSLSRMERIKTAFEGSFGLPNCCGALDATHIVMTLPAVQTSDDWCDQENNFSMFVQGIVDNELRFLDIVTGWPGGMSVSRLLKFSGFYKLCESGDRMNGEEYIVGGPGYPLLPWLVTPYEEDDDDISDDEVAKFNEVHEAVRSVAVKAFLQLKGSWRILNKVMWRPDKQKLPSIVLVCCLLHNIIIDCGDRLDSHVSLASHHDSGYVVQKCKHVNPAGKMLRNNLVKHLLCT